MSPIAYHFLKADMTAGSGDELAWSIGEERSVDGALKLCSRGYHSAPSWFDALQYAPGPVACLVEISAPEAKDDTKQVSNTRRLLAARNIDKELRLFACDLADEALTNSKVDDSRSRQAIEVARRFADGTATQEELAAAWDAARDAARDAAWDAARDAARDAAWVAAKNAAWVAAKNVARERFNNVVDSLFSASMASISSAPDEGE